MNVNLETENRTFALTIHNFIRRFSWWLINVVQAWCVWIHLRCGVFWWNFIV